MRIEIMIDKEQKISQSTLDALESELYRNLRPLWCLDEGARQASALVIVAAFQLRALQAWCALALTAALMHTDLGGRNPCPRLAQGFHGLFREHGDLTGMRQILVAVHGERGVKTPGKGHEEREDGHRDDGTGEPREKGAR